MSVKELIKLNYQELMELREKSDIDAMNVDKALRWIYKHKIETLKKAKLFSEIPKWESKLEKLDANKNKDTEGESESRPSIPEETKTVRSQKKSEVEL